MNRLRIVVEESAPGVYEVKYVGRDAGKAMEALRESTPNCRALYQYPKPSRYNRVTVAGGAEETPPPTNPAGAPEGPVEGLEVLDREPAAVADGVDEAAELVGRAPKAARAPRAPKAARR